MDFGYIDKEKITIETWDFEKIKIIQEFIAFQEEHGWAIDYEAIELDDGAFDDEEEKTPLYALKPNEKL